MPLTEEQINRIEEEERIRAEARNRYSKPRKKKTNWLGIIFVCVSFTICILVLSNQKSKVPQSQTAEPRQLAAKISNTNLGLNIYNEENVKWTSCLVRLNGSYKMLVDLNPGKNSFSYDGIINANSQRFNYSSIKPMDVSVKCENPLGEYYGNF